MPDSRVRSDWIKIAQHEVNETGVLSVDTFVQMTFLGISEADLIQTNNNNNKEVSNNGR